MKVDALGNIYVCGVFSDSTFTIGGTTTFINAAPGWEDVFLAKFDAAENLIWAKQAGGNSDDYFFSMCLDPTSSNIYCTGGFVSPTLVLGSITLTNTNTGNQEVFVVKYDTAGNVEWAKDAPNTGNAYYDAGNAITTNLNGDIYVVGAFLGSTITFGSFTLNNAGTLDDIFLAKYDASGNVIWAVRGGGTSFDRAYGCAITSDNKLIVSGQFYSSSISLGGITLTNAGATDIFIAKYDSSGNVIWAHGAGGSSSEYNTGCAVNSKNDIFIGGGFSSDSISFGSTTLTNVSGTSEDVFLVKYDSSGSALWAKSAGGTYVDEALQVTTDINDNIFIAGDYWSSVVMFDSLSFPNNSILFNPDPFVAKVSDATTGISLISPDNSITVFPNPSANSVSVLSSSSLLFSTATVFDAFGNKILSLNDIHSHQLTIDVSKFSNGVYFVSLEMNGKLERKSFVVQR